MVMEQNSGPASNSYVVIYQWLWHTFQPAQELVYDYFVASRIYFNFYIGRVHCEARTKKQTLTFRTVSDCRWACNVQITSAPTVNFRSSHFLFLVNFLQHIRSWPFACFTKAISGPSRSIHCTISSLSTNEKLFEINRSLNFILVYFPACSGESTILLQYFYGISHLGAALPFLYI